MSQKDDGPTIVEIEEVPEVPMDEETQDVTEIQLKRKREYQEDEDEEAREIKRRNTLEFAYPTVGKTYCQTISGNGPCWIEDLEVGKISTQGTTPAVFDVVTATTKVVAPILEGTTLTLRTTNPANVINATRLETTTGTGNVTHPPVLNGYCQQGNITSTIGTAIVLFAVQIEGGTMTQLGDTCEWEIWGTTLSNTNVKNIQVIVGATSIANFTLSISTNAAWRASVKLVRFTAANSFIYNILWNHGTIFNSSGVSTGTTDGGGFTFASNSLVQFAATTSGIGDVIVTGSTFKYVKTSAA